MDDLQRVLDWLRSFEGHDILADFRVDYTDQVPSQGAVFPQGLVEVERRENLLGDVTVQSQYNFGLYFVFEKVAGDAVTEKVNADWLMEFQRWVQQQSARRLVPNFGNTATPATARAQNGVLYDAQDSGTATYMVVLSITFVEEFKEENSNDKN